MNREEYLNEYPERIRRSKDKMATDPKIGLIVHKKNAKLDDPYIWAKIEDYAIDKGEGIYLLRYTNSDFGVWVSSYELEKSWDFLVQIEDQPQPIHNNHPAVWDLVIEDMRNRDKIGQERYGTRLQPFNGRKTMIDARDEILDFIVYQKQLEIELEEVLRLIEYANDTHFEYSIKDAVKLLRQILGKTGE